MNIHEKDYFVCPARTIGAFEAEMMFFYRHYKNGFLPVAGGFLDQTRRFLDAMVTIEGEINNVEAARVEALPKKRK